MTHDPRTEEGDAGLPLWVGLALSTLSGILMALAMPTHFDLGWLGWFGLVPALAALMRGKPGQVFLLTIPVGVIWSIAAHSWYPDFFGWGLGLFLIVAVGFFYGGLLQAGLALQDRLPKAIRVLALPTVWAGLEFLKFIAPVVRDWWFVLLANIAWEFPPALQILTLTGFPGLSFLIMLVNVALTQLILHGIEQRKAHPPGLIALGAVAAILIWGALIIRPAPAESFRIAGTVDLSYQDPAIQTLSALPADSEGYYADTAELSQALFDRNAALTQSVADENIAFAVWPENEWADADDAQFTDQAGALAEQLNIYLVTDMIWHDEGRMYDTAVLFSPDGTEAGRRAKINITGGEEDFGFSAGPLSFPVFETPYGRVGVGVCWDRHTLWIPRDLARAGARIILMPVDDDFRGNRAFPPLHAADAVFRAVENRVAFGMGTTNGISMVIDPYGRITARSGINEAGVVVGEAFIVDEQTLYMRIGDWFGWLCLGLSALGFAIPWGQAGKSDG